MSDVRSYWRAYGGALALVRSPYLWGAAALTVLCERFWTAPDPWADTALDVLPNLLGFSLGAMAVVLAFPTTGMFKHLAEDGRKDSYYIQLAAKLVHFIFVQVAGILSAILFKTGEADWLDWITFFFLTYSILTAIAVALALFNIATLYNEDGGGSN